MKPELLSKAIKVENFNTCNGWGFAGGVGTQLIFPNNVRIRMGVAYYRHLPSNYFVAVYKDDKRVIDTTTLTDKHYAKIKELISSK